jgi:hypothetical protein
MSSRYYIFPVPTRGPFFVGDGVYGNEDFSGVITGVGGQATAERSPVSDDSASGDWSGTFGSRYQLVDDYPDPTGIDYLQFGPTAGHICFGFSPFNVPVGATIHAVQILVYITEVAGGTNRWYGRAKVGGNYYNDATAHFPTSTQWSQQSARLSSNPKTGLPWTVDDVNGAGANALQGFGAYSTDVSPAIRFSSMALQVIYSIDSPEDDYVDIDFYPGSTEYPAIGSLFRHGDTGYGLAYVLPWDDARSGYLYPDPYGPINYGSPTYPDNPIPLLPGDLVTDYESDLTVMDVVTEATAGSFKGEAAPGYGKMSYAGGQVLWVNRGGQWFSSETWPRDPMYLPSMQLVPKYNVRITSLTGELFPVAGYDLPYREKVKMKLLIRGEA